MARLSGVLLVCDRCGNSIFLERNFYGEAPEPPDGWEHQGGLLGHLCPDCNAEYLAMLAEFKEKKKPEIKEEADECI